MNSETAREVLRKKGMTEAEIDDFLRGVEEGTKAYLEGRVKPWSQVKKELGIK